MTGWPVLHPELEEPKIAKLDPPNYATGHFRPQLM